MKNYVIWIDREHAKIFQFDAEQASQKNLSVKHTEHHTHRQDNFDHMRYESRLFADSAAQLKSAEKLLILGPGVAKHHFQNYLAEHFPLLSKKVVACESSDHPTDPQLFAYAKKYFIASELAEAAAQA